MKGKIISIGDELLSGRTLNTNACYIAKQLDRIGVTVGRELTIGDDPDEIAQAIDREWGENTLLLATGGLGPTVDDRTRLSIARCVNKKLVEDPDVLKDLQKRFGSDFPTLRDQALIPEGATPFLNRVGTAPAVAVVQDRRALILLPGVPSEMKSLLIESVIPWIEENYSLPTPRFRRTLSFAELSEHTIDKKIRALQEEFPSVKFGIYPGLGLVSVEISAEQEKELEGPIRDLLVTFGASSFEGTLEKAVQKTFVENGWSVSVAESCTGGMVSALLTSVPGASRYFLGGFVTYSNSLKSSTLSVPEALLASNGAVSEEVVRAMATGVLAVSQSHFSLAVTGISGPEGGSVSKPVGTVWCAVSQKDSHTTSWKLELAGDRERVNQRATQSLLTHLLLRARESIL